MIDQPLLQQIVLSSGGLYYWWPAMETICRVFQMILHTGADSLLRPVNECWSVICCTSQHREWCHVINESVVAAEWNETSFDFCGSYYAYVLLINLSTYFLLRCLTHCFFFPSLIALLAHLNSCGFSGDIEWYCLEGRCKTNWQLFLYLLVSSTLMSNRPKIEEYIILKLFISAPTAVEWTASLSFHCFPVIFNSTYVYFSFLLSARSYNQLIAITI